MFISSADDTTVFAFEGCVEGKINEMFIINKFNDTGVRSAYTKENSNADSLQGIRIRRTVTFNGVGNAAPLYITVYGLTEQELPVATCPSGVHHVQLPDLSYGASQDCSNTTIGHMIFLRSTEPGSDVSTDQLNHEKYRNESTREFYLPREVWTRNDPVVDDNVWINW